MVSKDLSLIEHDIAWYSRKYDGINIAFNCSDFPNIPLFRIKCCLNYNPILALRQSDYPMEDKPVDNMIEELIMHKGLEDPTLLRKVSRDWVRIKTRNERKILEGKIALPRNLIVNRFQKECVKLSYLFAKMFVSTLRPPSLFMCQ